MLPSHLLDASKKRGEPLNHTRLGQPPPPPMPSLCVTGAMCQQGRMEIVNNNNNNEAEKGFARISIFYCIFRPRQLHDCRKPPLVVLHGGPSIPSNYLLPIVNGVTDRAIIFYDQWGCGKSSRPPLDHNEMIGKTKYKFSIDTMVDHLHRLLTKQWGLKAYHLLGHSFGGLLAYEYLLKYNNNNNNNNDGENNNNNNNNNHEGRCMSVILASTPTSAALIERESKRLFRAVNNLSTNDDDNHDDNKEDENDGNNNGNKDKKDDNDDVEQYDRARKQQMDENFRQTHECRLAHTPLALMDALAQAGPTLWRGIQAIADYEASGSLLSNIPALVLVGEYDFCTAPCVEGWKDLFSNPTPETTTLTNCSHYGMLEDERQYGKAITDFLHRHEDG